MSVDANSFAKYTYNIAATIDVIFWEICHILGMVSDIIEEADIGP